MKNLRIRGKLAASFATMLVIMLAIGLLSIHSQATLNGSAVQVGQTEVPRLQALSTVTSSLSNYRAMESAHILAALPDEIAEADAKISALRTKIDTATAYLETHASTAESRTAFSTFRTKMKAYLQSSNALLDQSRRNLDIEATDAFQTEEPVFVDLNTRAQQLLDARFGDVKLLAEAGTQTYSFGWMLTVAGLVVAFVSVACLLMMLLRSIATPLGQMTGAMTELGRGNNAVVLPVVNSRDEVADLAAALHAFRDQLAHAEQAKQVQADMLITSVGTGLDHLAAGNLDARITADLTGPFAKLKDDFNNAIAQLQGTMQQVAQSSNGIHLGAEDIRQASNDLSLRTEQQAATLEETAAAMEEITTTVRQTASSAGEVTTIVGQAQIEAEQSGEVVRRAVQAMHDIEHGSNEISEIITVIDGIAFQTNLLALNAGVEAARAGDAGRGFAVVASEVRALAQRSADAAKDVKLRILASSRNVQSGVQLVGDTGKALERIIVQIGAISGAVTHIAASAEQQSTALQHVNVAIGEMDGVTQQNAAMVQEATASADELLNQANDLAAQVGHFTIGSGGHGGNPVHAMQHRLRAA